MRKNLKPPRMSIFSIQNCPPRSFLWNFVTFFEFLETILFLLQCNLNFFDKFTCLWICILNFRSVRLRFRYNILKNILLQCRWICNDNIFNEQLIQNDVACLVKILIFSWKMSTNWDCKICLILILRRKCWKGLVSIGWLVLCVIFNVQYFAKNHNIYQYQKPWSRSGPPWNLGLDHYSPKTYTFKLNLTMYLCSNKDI